MKKLMRACLLLLAVVLSVSTRAQDTKKISVGPVITEGAKVLLTVSATEPFYVGDNTHVLHIGHQRFALYIQRSDDTENSLTFLIPAEAFGQLPEGAPMYLTYGEEYVPYDEQEWLDACVHSPSTHQSVGKFSKSMLTSPTSK